MKIRFLAPPTWSISRELTKWARRLKIPLAGPQPVQSVIVVGNGTPDEVVCLILCHKLNGENVVGITKPQEKLRIDSITPALELIRREKVKNLLIALDQERESLEELWKRIEGKFKEEKLKYKIESQEEKFCAYTCSQAHYKFKILMTINGLNRPYQKNTIEDHLLEFSREFLEEDANKALNNSNKDPKEAWKKLVDRHQEIYSSLSKRGHDKMQQIFPQHIKALSELL
jgi:stress-induced morphogen